MKKRKLTSTIILFLIVFLIGYCRETIFIVINSVIKEYSFPYNASYISPPKILYSYTINSLVMTKWVLTFVFSMLFMSLSILIVKVYFNNLRLIAYTIIIYFVIILVALIIIGIGYLLNFYESVYPISRFFMGLAQSPLTVLMLFVVFYFRGLDFEK